MSKDLYNYEICEKCGNDTYKVRIDDNGNMLNIYLVCTKCENEENFYYDTW